MADTSATPYVLDDQIGYLLRLAAQRHALIFQTHAIDNLTPTQFSTLLRLSEGGQVSQNQLGRMAAMDIATTKGVVDRLKAKGLVKAEQDKTDKRRSLISLTARGNELVQDLFEIGAAITRETLAPLSEEDSVQLVALLRKIT